MAKQQTEDSILVSAARAVGVTLGRMKRLTTKTAQGYSTNRQNQEHQDQKTALATRARNTTTAAQPQPQTRPARPSRKRVPIIDEPDAAMASPQEGGSRSPHQTESSRRGKSRSKTKSRRG